MVNFRQLLVSITLIGAILVAASPTPQPYPATRESVSTIFKKTTSAVKQTAHNLKTGARNAANDVKATAANIKNSSKNSVKPLLPSSSKPVAKQNTPISPPTQSMLASTVRKSSLEPAKKQDSVKPTPSKSTGTAASAAALNEHSAKSAVTVKNPAAVVKVNKPVTMAGKAGQIATNAVGKVGQATMAVVNTGRNAANTAYKMGAGAVNTAKNTVTGAANSAYKMGAGAANAVKNSVTGAANAVKSKIW
ncbi:hypothetical protein BJ085DRAFT_37787 [Dimargaris cristalligena]|uniref:Uncharacterized protein n=1 Tax=Dimargaris cristalligena TaxID=215637 RepID=A0A4P9ZIV5_9FUNG|nr:hypothetical protein BJ085DRAFT_37787 [Dimargaris cristalligena]|eukprot:RKP33134.1 hypothetical protein BJ085DRAFT_37787 [Dimargaris cristalligena]